jgi:FAR1 DNA-binding domain
MEFDSIEYVYQFYKDYGLRHSFGIVKRSNHKKDGACYHYALGCNKHKKPVDRDCNLPPLPERNRSVLGTECKAMLTVSDPGLLNHWVVTKVNLEHNHVLTPDISYLITTYREIPIRFKKQLETNDDDGMPALLNITTVIKHAGGYGKCPFTCKDARNHIDKYRREKARHLSGNDSYILMDYFEKKMIMDPNFFFSYNFDKDGRLLNVLWFDGRSRAAYRYFSALMVEI